MTRPLTPSDDLPKRSDDLQEPFCHSLAQTTTPTGAGGRRLIEEVMRHIERGLQTLRSAQLPLCRRPGPRAEALPVCQPSRRLAAQRLYTQRRCGPRQLNSSATLHKLQRIPSTKFVQSIRSSFLTPRGSWIDHDGSCIHPVRLNTGGVPFLPIWSRPISTPPLAPCGARSAMMTMTNSKINQTHF